jgi:hypothetical protein
MGVRMQIGMHRSIQNMVLFSTSSLDLKSRFAAKRMARWERCPVAEVSMKEVREKTKKAKKYYMATFSISIYPKELRFWRNKVT